MLYMEVNFYKNASVLLKLTKNPVIGGQQVDSRLEYYVNRLSGNLKMLGKVRNPLLHVTVCLNLISSINQGLTYLFISIIIPSL